MEYTEAELILNPETTLVALGEIEYYAGFSSKSARMKAVDEACLVACEALNRLTPKSVTHEATLLRCCTCPNCKGVLDEFDDFMGQKVRVTFNNCHFCGQALDWSNE